MEFTDLENPRIGNTGVQNTEKVLNTNNSNLFITDYAVKDELKSLIDWCEFTLPMVYSLDKVFEILQIPKEQNFTQLDNGKRLLGYSEIWTNGHIKVLTAGTVEMGHHVLMSGQGCREYELFCGDRWKEFIQDIILHGGKFSRLDVAIDDFKGYFLIKDCYEKLINGECASRFKFAKNMEKIRIADGYINGQTLYYGSEKSELQVRMYEKNHEQDLDAEIEIWNRTELQMRDSRAMNFAQAFVSDEKTVGEYASMVLKQYISFKVRDENDSNKGRWEVCEWWDNFLGDVDKLKLTTKKPDRTVDRIEGWLDKQVSKSMAIIATLKPEEIKNLILKGQEKFTEEDEILIWNYITEKNRSQKALELKKETIKKNLLKKRRLNQ